MAVDPDNKTEPAYFNPNEMCLGSMVATSPEEHHGIHKSFEATAKYSVEELDIYHYQIEVLVIKTKTTWGFVLVARTILAIFEVEPIILEAQLFYYFVRINPILVDLD